MLTLAASPQLHPNCLNFCCALINSCCAKAYSRTRAGCSCPTADGCTGNTYAAREGERLTPAGVILAEELLNPLTGAIPDGFRAG